MHKYWNAAIIACSLGAIAPSLLAQRGDRGGGEVQAPPPASLVIPPAPFLTPEDELKTFKVAPGFRVELIAAEPMVQEPVVMQFAPDGKLWVAEMRAYMVDVDGTGESDPIGDIAVLEDTNGDGRFDKKTIFADNLYLPRAISLIDGGALIASSPYVWFMKDTNGDGVADVKTEIANNYGNLSGPEHNANSLFWAMDNYIYNGESTIRYRYEGNGKFSTDTTISRGQWQVTQDNVGRLYYNSNSDPLRVDLLPSAYLRRNPGFTGAGTNLSINSSPLTIFPGRVTPGINRGYQSLNAEGKYTSVTSASGTVVYRGTLFPSDFLGDVFICESTANLVKRIKITEANGTLSARNAYDNDEFLTSTDERFRPVTLTNGPDGALYIIDMYHGIIQHRNYVTTYLRNQIIDRKLEAPIHVGRIWRVVPTSLTTRPAVPNLSRMTPAQLVPMLGETNGWTRDTAQRLLVEKKDPSIAPALRTFVGTSPNPLGKVHALWTLDGLNAMDRPTALRALSDSDSRVVIAALAVSEKLFASAATVDTTVLDRAIALASSSDPAIRLRAALSLGEARTPAADAALRRLILTNPDQPFLADAVLSGLGGRDEKFVLALIAEAKDAPKSPSAFITTASGSVLRSGDASRINALLEGTLSDSAPAWARTAILDGLQALAGGGGRAGGGGGGRAGGAGGGAAAPAGAAVTPPTPAAPGGRAGQATAGGRAATPALTIASAPIPDDAAAPAPAARGAAGGGRGGAAAAGPALPAEPKALVALAERNSGPDSVRAATLLQGLRWTGKPGMEVVQATPLTPAQQALFDKGKTHYDTLCASCHQPTALGLAGIAPALVNSKYVLGDDRVLAQILLAGKTDQATTAPFQVLTMPALRGLMDDEAIASVLTYVRRSFGHIADPVTPATVSQARQAVANKQDNWNEASLNQLLQQLPAAPRGGRGNP